MPCVTALMLSTDAKKSMKTFKAGPCVSVTTVKTDLTINKATYTFVPPSYSKQWSGDLDSIQDNAQFQRLVSDLENYITVNPAINSVHVMNEAEDDTGKLPVGVQLVILGINMGYKHPEDKDTKDEDKSKIKWDTVDGAISSWTNNRIVVSFATAPTKSAPITLLQGKAVVVQSKVYEVLKKPTP